MITPEMSAESFAKLSDPNRGRIVAVGISPDGDCFRLFTGMGGRSVGSKNRIYKQYPDLNGNGDFIRTAVHDPNLQTGDPAATIYVAHRAWNDWHVASNGEQTEGIAVALAVGAKFEDGQRLYKNEGPKNGYTARITVAINTHDHVAYMGRIISDRLAPEQSHYWVHRFGLDFGFSLNDGEGYLTSTYDGQGEMEANREEPWGVLLGATLEEDLDGIWNSWDPKTKASLTGKELARGSDRFSYSFRSIHRRRVLI